MEGDFGVGVESRWKTNAKETGAIPLEKLTSMALETDRRALTNRVIFMWDVRAW
jgi:hypothetical protein